MQFRFSEPFESLKPSVLRESFKLAAQPGVISLAAGSPSPASFPAMEMAGIAQRLLSDSRTAAKVLQYGVTEGVEELRQLVLERMASRYSTGGDGDGIMITSGGQQGIELAAKVFLDRSDSVITESPTFSNAINTFKAFTSNIAAVRMEPDGMDMGALEEKLREVAGVKLIYCIPTFQNPTGYTMSIEKRRALYGLARRFDAMIVEDDPYRDLRYDGDDVPTIKSMDEDGRVIYVGSLSKILSPGMRLGFVIAPKEVLAKLVIAKQGEDVHANVLCQAIAVEYLKEFDLEAHIQGIRDRYRRKRDFMIGRLEAELPANVAFSRPEGGLFIWCTMPPGCDSDELFMNCFERGKVLITTGSGFYPELVGKCRSFRLSYTLPSEENIERGIEVVARCLGDLMGEVR
jgi:2-aminoadipate transaminase